MVDFGIEPVLSEARHLALMKVDYTSHNYVYRDAYTAALKLSKKNYKNSESGLKSDWLHQLESYNYANLLWRRPYFQKQILPFLIEQYQKTESRFLKYDIAHTFSQSQEELVHYIPLLLKLFKAGDRTFLWAIGNMGPQASVFVDEILKAYGEIDENVHFSVLYCLSRICQTKEERLKYFKLLLK